LVAGLPVGDGTLQVLRPDLGRLRHVHGSGPLRWHFGNPTDTRELTPETATHIGQMLLDENTASVNTSTASATASARATPTATPATPGVGFPRNRGGFLYAASGWMAAIFSYSTGGSNPAELWRRRVL
jgi:hypothetical protein